jgi:transposase
MAYSMDLGQRVLADGDAGVGTLAVAGKYRVSPAWVRRLKQWRRVRGDVGPRTHRCGRKALLADHLPRLRELVAQTPDATLKELQQQLGVAVDLSTIWRTLQRLRLSFKKKCCTPRSRSAPMSKQPARLGGR